MCYIYQRFHIEIGWWILCIQKIIGQHLAQDIYSHFMFMLWLSKMHTIFYSGSHSRENNQLFTKTAWKLRQQIWTGERWMKLREIREWDLFRAIAEVEKSVERKPIRRKYNTVKWKMLHFMQSFYVFNQFVFYFLPSYFYIKCQMTNKCTYDLQCIYFATLDSLKI